MKNSPLCIAKRSSGSLTRLTLIMVNITLSYLTVERYEGIVPEQKKDMSQGFTGFVPEFLNREIVSGGFLRNNIICWPVHIKSHLKGGDEVLMMIQMSGGNRAIQKYNAIDMTLMNIMSKVAGGALLKIKSERVTMDSLKKSNNMFESFRHLLSERNHAILSQLIKSQFGKLFRFKNVGIMFAEKSRQGFNPDKNQLYSIVVGDDQVIPKNFVLTDSNVVMHSTSSGLTGMAIANPGTLIVANLG